MLLTLPESFQIRRREGRVNPCALFRLRGMSGECGSGEGAKICAHAAAATTFTASLARNGTTETLISVERLVFASIAQPQSPIASRTMSPTAAPASANEKRPLAIAAIPIDQPASAAANGAASRYPPVGPKSCATPPSPMRAEDRQAGRAFQQIERQRGKADPGRQQQSQQQDGKRLQGHGHRRKPERDGDVCADATSAVAADHDPPTAGPEKTRNSRPKRCCCPELSGLRLWLAAVWIATLWRIVLFSRFLRDIRLSATTCDQRSSRFTSVSPA